MSDSQTGAGPEGVDGHAAIDRFMNLDGLTRSLETHAMDYSREIGLALQALRSCGEPNESELTWIREYAAQVEVEVAALEGYESGTKSRDQAEADAIKEISRATRRLQRGLTSTRLGDKPDLPGAVSLVPSERTASVRVRIELAEGPTLPELTRLLSALDLLFHGLGADRSELTLASNAGCETNVRAEFPDKTARDAAEDGARGVTEALYEALGGDVQAAHDPAEDPSGGSLVERPETMEMRQSLLDRTAAELQSTLVRQTSFRFQIQGGDSSGLLLHGGRLALSHGDVTVREVLLDSSDPSDAAAISVEPQRDQT